MLIRYPDILLRTSILLSLCIKTVLSFFKNIVDLYHLVSIKAIWSESLMFLSDCQHMLISGILQINRIKIGEECSTQNTQRDKAS